MNKYIQNGEIEEASEYAKTFGTDMRIHIRNKMLEKIKEEEIISTPELFIEANFMCKVFFFLNQMLWLLKNLLKPNVLTTEMPFSQITKKQEMLLC